jgi:hypothetical protein
MAIFSPLPGSRACLGRGPRQVPGSAVAATDTASVHGDCDNGAEFRSTLGSRRRDERVAHPLDTTQGIE